jgi:glycosyltransferase involved in cell wall biosynthesis
VNTPIRLLELRCADGQGGGPEKTILLGAAKADPRRLAVTVGYIRNSGDLDSTIKTRAVAHGVDLVEIRQRNALDPQVWTKVRRIVTERQIDIVHAHDYKTDLIAWLLGKKERVIPVTTAHGWTGHSWRERRIYYPSDKCLMRRFPQVIAVSSQVRDELVASGVSPQRIHTILNGIDHWFFRRDPKRVEQDRAGLGVKPGEVVIGAVGRLEPQKRFDILIRAFATLRQAYPQLRLAIAGEGSKRADLETIIRMHDLGESCRLLGHCSDIVAFYHAIDMLAQSSDYEGTPNVVLEAMALEIPIVATNAGGTAELVTHGVHGLIVPPGDPAALAGAIEQTMREWSAAASRVSAAHHRVQDKFSFDARQEALEAIYRDLVAR